MLRNKRKMMYVHLVASMVLMVSFQNCGSQYGVETSTGSSTMFSKSDGAAVVVDEENVPDIPSTDMPQSNNNGNNDGSVANDNHDCREDENEISAAEAVQYCEMRGNDKAAKDMSAISNISDLRGMMSFKISSLSFVQNVNGKLRLQGTQENSEVALMENVRGLVILCNVSVKEMKNGNGNVILVNSQIEHLEGHQGSIKVVNGAVGEVVNHRGNVKYLDQI